MSEWQPLECWILYSLINNQFNDVSLIGCEPHADVQCVVARLDSACCGRQWWQDKAFCLFQRGSLFTGDIVKCVVCLIS